MSSDRLQRLLNCSYCGLCREVLIESPCFQLGPAGDIIRHVYIGVTKRELLIAQQQIYPDVNVICPYIDPDLDGLEMIRGLPLGCCHFTMWDDRSCRFAVCMDTGVSYFFEVCNVFDGSDAPWAAWRAYIAWRGDTDEFGYKPWRIYPSASDFIKPETDYSDVKYLKRPACIPLVRSIGTQVCEEFDYFREYNKSSVVANYGYPPSGYLYISEGVSVCKETSQQHTSIPELQHDRPRRIGLMQVASDIHLHKNKDTSMDNGGKAIVGNKSETDLSLNSRGRETNSDCWKKRVFFTLLESDHDTAADRLSTLFPNWGISEDTLEEYTKIWRARSKKPPLRPTEISSQDSSEIQGDTKPQQQRRHQHLRRSLSEKVLGVFRRRPSRRTSLHMERFSDAKIAEELTLMAAQCVLQVTEEDVMAHRAGSDVLDIPGLMDVYNCTTTVARFVINEVLSAEGVEAQASVIDHYVQVANHCFAAQDLLTLSTILNGLQSLTVSNLTEAWATFRQQYGDSNRTLKEVEQLFNPGNRFKTYLDHYEKLQTSELPYLPWFDHFLWHTSNVLPKQQTNDNIVIDDKLADIIAPEPKLETKDRHKPRLLRKVFTCIYRASRKKAAKNKNSAGRHAQSKGKRTPSPDSLSTLYEVSTEADVDDVTKENVNNNEIRIGLVSRSATNARERKFREQERERENERRKPEAAQLTNVITSTSMADRPCCGETSARSVTSQEQSLPSASTSDSSSIGRPPSSKSEEKQMYEEHARIAAKTSKSSPIIKKSEEEKHGHVAISVAQRLPECQEDIITEGAGPTDDSRREKTPEDARARCNACDREACVYGGDVVWALQKMQGAAIRYKQQQNAGVREYITQPVLPDYQLLQLSLQYQTPQCEDQL